MPAISPARAIAFDVLARVEDGGYASDLLLAQSASLDTRDAGLAAEIVFGTLRYQGQLDFLIAHFSGRPAGGLDLEVRLALRMGIYQLRYLDRIPRHAAVDESVELVKRAHKRSAAGLVNAVLRKVGRDPVTFPDRATELSYPPWLLERWDRRFGRETADRIARAFLDPPEKYIRIPGAPPPELRVEPTEIAGCYRLLEGEASGFRQQDISSQSIVPLLDLRPGHTFLDLCAAPGNKTAQALETPVRAVACDLHLHRLRALAGLSCGRVVADATQPLPFGRRFDRILLDAPCSGTGTLGRNPEIKWRIQPGDFQALARKQAALLGRALECLAPGGRLVYSTCSLEAEENEEVLQNVLGRVPDDILRRTPGSTPGDGFWAAVIGFG